MRELVTTVSPRPAEGAAEPVGGGCGQVRFETLGRLVVDGDRPGAPPGPHKMRLVLAVLLIRAGQVVTTDELIDDVWGADPPRRALAALQVYVSRLRKALHTDDESGPRIVTHRRGYLMTLRTDELDCHVFHRLLAEGRARVREGDHPEAVAALDKALSLWRGTPLDGLHDSPTVRAFVTWLQELRLECFELLVEAGLALGRHRDLVGLLYGLTAEQPLREAFQRQLMLALYRSERQADALKVYRSARAALTEQVGVEPGRALTDLQYAILNGDERLHHG